MKDFYASFPPHSFDAIIKVHFEVQVQEEAKGKVGEKMIGCVAGFRLSSTLAGQMGENAMEDVSSTPAGQIFTQQAGFREFDYW